MTVVYEIRSKRNWVVMSFSTLERATKVLREKSVEVKGLRLFEITRTVRELTP
jgi:hypothetical protein